MKVILKKDVIDLGKVGEVVSVTPGFARNLLFPRKLAVEATEKRMKEWTHLQKIAEIQKKKAHQERQTVLEKVDGTRLSFQAQASDTGTLFGSVTTQDISKKLAQQGHEIDKKDIHVEPLKMLGEFQALIKVGELEAKVTVSVEKAT